MTAVSSCVTASIFRCWVSRHVEVKNTSVCNFHDDEDIDELESCRHNDKEVSGNDRFSVVVQERHPSLLWVWGTFECFGHVAPHRAWRNSDSDFQQQFISNTFFAPSWIVEGHFLNELLNLGGNLRSTARSRFPFPKQAEAFAVPTNQGVGFDSDQGVSPIKPAGESDESESDRIGSPSWFDVSFDKKAQLFGEIGFRRRQLWWTSNRDA